MFNKNDNGTSNIYWWQKYK